MSNSNYCLDAFLLLNRIKNGEEVLNKISSGEKFYYLLHNLKTTKKIKDSFPICRKFANNLPMYQIDYIKLEQANYLMESLI